jgi:hypothetical protein
MSRLFFLRLAGAVIAFDQNGLCAGLGPYLTQRGFRIDAFRGHPYSPRYRAGRRWLDRRNKTRKFEYLGPRRSDLVVALKLRREPIASYAGHVSIPQARRRTEILGAAIVLR